MSSTPTTSDQPSILVIEDSAVTRNILREELEAEGYTVYVAEDGPAGLDLARDWRPDIILLDVALPSASGLDICRELKDGGPTSATPVVFLSAANELKDKLAGFEAGADDYLTKPFFTRELIARLRAHRRGREALASSRKLGQFYLEMLFSIGSTISSPFSSDDELEVILRQALVGVRARKGAILLLGEDGGLEVRGIHGYNGNGNGTRIGQSFRVSDKLPLVGDSPAAPLAIRVYEDPEAQTAFVPMVAREKLIGGIEIDLEGGSRRFSADDQKILHALASQAAIFIENARLERDARTMFLNIIVSLAGAVDAKDAYTHGHSLRVARTALIVAQQLGLERERLEPLLLSAILHDVGKIAIPDEILKKPGRLTDEEFDVMKGHVTSGARMLAHIDALEDVIPGILYHHEHWNGSGYPEGLAGEDIPQIGRIILIGDAFDAMTTDRIYRKSRPVTFAMDQIRDHAGAQFDPDAAAAALDAYRTGVIHDDTPQETPTIFELIEQIQG